MARALADPAKVRILDGDLKTASFDVPVALSAVSKGQRARLRYAGVRDWLNVCVSAWR
ncbi:MAG: hypothetical protein ABJB78_04435 [Betaproteobacteria bacterium]